VPECLPIADQQVEAGVVGAAAGQLGEVVSRRQVSAQVLFRQLAARTWDDHLAGCANVGQRGEADRKSVVEGKRVSVRVDLGGRRIIKKKNEITHCTNNMK